MIRSFFRSLSRLSWIMFGLLIFFSIFSAYSASNIVISQELTLQTFAVGANDFKPAECTMLLAGFNKNDGNALLLGTDGNDSINGGNGDDCIIGGDGDDTLNGKNGDDVILGQEGDDTLTGGNGTDYCDGGPGTDEDTKPNKDTCETQISIEQ